jgi:D-amino-acid oxidase
MAQAHPQQPQSQLRTHSVGASAPAAAPFEPSVVVVGAGCCGLGVAVQLLRAGHRVALVTKDHTPRTTSDQAGALWRPFGEVSGDNAAQFAKWGQQTFQFLNEARLEHGSNNTGIMLVSGFEVFSSAQSRPFWAGDVLNFKILDAAELETVGLKGHKHGFSYTSLIIDMDVYMRWLHREFHRLGGKLHIAALEHLSDAQAKLYPTAKLIVNCTGLGAKTLVSDKELFPVAGHIVKVALPGLHHFFMDSDVRKAEQTAISGAFNCAVCPTSSISADVFFLLLLVVCCCA